MARLPVWGLVLLCAACARRPEPRTVSVAAAADLSFAMDEIARQYHRLHPGVELRTAYGSSGNFYAQIRNGAPFDVFLSADMEYPRKLAQEGIGAPDSVFVYGAGRLVVWVTAKSGRNPETALRDSSIRSVAIANPQHAPYGRAAEAALRSLGLYRELGGKLVFGENVAQALSFVRSGAADAGIVALSLALAPAARRQGRYWEIPQAAYPPIRQAGIVLKPSAGARDLRSFLLSAGGRAILERYGFTRGEP